MRVRLLASSPGSRSHNAPKHTRIVAHAPQNLAQSTARTLLRVLGCLPDLYNLTITAYAISNQQTERGTRVDSSFRCMPCTKNIPEKNVNRQACAQTNHVRCRPRIALTHSRILEPTCNHQFLRSKSPGAFASTLSSSYLRRRHHYFKA